MHRNNHYPTNIPILLSKVSLQQGDKTIPKDVSLMVRKGERVIISGHSGAGKSSLLRLIAGIERPTSGSVRLFGEDINQLSNHRKRELIAGKVGVGFQTPRLDGGFSLLENTLTMEELIRPARSLHRLANLLIELGLDSRVHQEADTLSGGEKQRLALAGLLLPAPDLILLDEPTSMIDTSGKQDIYRIVKQDVIERHATLVMVSHDEVPSDFTTREIVVEEGHIVNDIKYPS